MLYLSDVPVPLDTRLLLTLKKLFLAFHSLGHCLLDIEIEMRVSIVVAALAAAFTTSASPMPVVKLPRGLTWANNTIAARVLNETVGFNVTVKRDNITSNYTSNYTSRARAVSIYSIAYIECILTDDDHRLRKDIFPLSLLIPRKTLRILEHS